MVQLYICGTLMVRPSGPIVHVDIVFIDHIHVASFMPVSSYNLVNFMQFFYFNSKITQKIGNNMGPRPWVLPFSLQGALQSTL